MTELTRLLALALLAGACSAPAAPVTPRSEPEFDAAAETEAVRAARAYRTAHGAEILADFATLLAIPNVGSDSAGIHRAR